MKQTSASGTLKVGKIAANGYGYSISNWNSPNNGRDSSFSSNLEALGLWGSTLVLRLSGLNDLSLYPNFCKLYVNDELVFIGKKGYNAGEFFAYNAYPSENSYDIKEIFSESKIGISYNVQIDFFDTL
ncbi:hypothetical protein RHO12_01655 [Orbus sturtevantii]|uniref:hypothetical protein n=1 Tax=Orbus sturtevantii TaxID=3074109 RepID=UPI00370D1A6A